MRNRWSALVGVVLTLVLMPRVGAAQAQQAGPRKAGSLEQNYPNPFNPHAWMPFTVGEDYPACADRGRQYRVTLRVLNVLAQRVATPQLEGSSGGVAGGQRLENVLLSCGRYIGFWDGKLVNTSREAPSGIYLWVLEVDGRQAGVKKSILVK